MKSLVAVLLGISLGFGIFMFQTSGTTLTMHNGMSPAEHAAMSSDCGSGTCTTAPTDCAAMCFVASGFQIDNDLLPGSSLTLLTLLVALLALVWSRDLNFRPRLAFQSLSYHDPYLILTTQKRE